MKNLQPESKMLPDGNPAGTLCHILILNRQSEIINRRAQSWNQ